MKSAQFQRCLDLAKEIEAFPLGDCGPSDDPDKQTAFVYEFRRLVTRFVASAKRVQNPDLQSAVAALNTRPSTLLEAYELSEDLTAAIDILRDLQSEEAAQVLPASQPANAVDVDGVIRSAYRLKIRTLQQRTSEEESELLGLMRGGNSPGHGLQVLVQHAGKLASAAVERCEAAIPDLIKAHLDIGDVDARRISESIRTQFVDVVLRGLPAAGHYVSLRGGAGPNVEGARVRQSEEAVFSSRKASLRQAVEDYVLHAISEYNVAKASQLGAGRLERPSEGDMPIRSLAQDRIAIDHRDGTRTENVLAMVQKDLIFVADASVALEEGDTISRKLPSGGLEYFEVLDRGFQAGMGGIEPHYQARVKRTQGAPPQLPKPHIDTRRVFVVHGRNGHVRRALGSFLRAINLSPIEWSEAVSLTGSASPFIGEVIEAGFGAAQAAVILLTGDDLAQLHPALVSDGDPDYERELLPQARPNVLFEAGYAFARHPKRTVLVEFGRLRPFSDVQGRHVLRMDNSTQKRQELAERLRTAGCDVNLANTVWHTEGNFETP